MTEAHLTDIATLRSRARQNVENGAVTEGYDADRQEIIRLGGSVELAPLVGLSDVILDIVESGNTLAANGLTVLEEVCPVSARLVVNRVSLKTRTRQIRALVEALQRQL